MRYAWRTLALLIPATALHAFVLGGGLSDKDCRMAFGGLDATDGASGVLCADGDPACDRDGAVDGSCRFTVSLCTGVPEEGCTPESVSSIAVAGQPLVPPPLPSTPDTCGPSLDVVVPVGTAAAVTAIARAGDALKDVDYLELCCGSAAMPADPVRCALAVDLGAAGCTKRVPAGIVRRFAHARALIDDAAAHPTRARRDERRAGRAIQTMQRLARRLADRDACGDALGLIAGQVLAGLGNEPAFATRPAP